MLLVARVPLSKPAGYAALEREEGVRLRVYPDSAGYSTIGYGHLLTATEKAKGRIVIGTQPVRWVGSLTLPQAEALLKQDVSFAEHAIDSLVTRPLLQNQYDALTSFVFNVGRPKFARSTLLKIINRGDDADVPREMQRWASAGGKHDLGLAARRVRESALWKGNTP